MPVWNWFQFDKLAVSQLYDILQLRELVFTFGQQCDEQDMDGIDKTALHFTGYDGDKLVAYLRVYQVDQKCKIGRVVVHPDHQGHGLGREMMIKALPFLLKQFPEQSIEMSAQYYLEKFYQSLGFETVSDIYMEAGIQHVRMVYAKH